jgi:cytochrome o ubiquinol oxidase operon protein cyoD
MSKELHNTQITPESEHVSLTPYVVGFLLSLLFTFIPYQLVVNEILTGSMLLAAIIGCAMVQLVIQVVFFLHLGREKKPRFNLFFLLGTIGIIMIVVLGSIWIMNHLHHNMSATDVTDKVASDEAVHQISGSRVGTCEGVGVNHKIELKNDTATPLRIEAKQCDTITFSNRSDATREIRFGTREDPETYAGASGETVRARRNKIFTLTELGIHQFYDPINNKVSGYFTVK